MSVSRETLLHVAHLARLRLSEPELQRADRDLNALLNVLDQLASVETQGVKPLFHPGDVELHLRADQACQMSDSERAAFQAIAPEISSDLYLVPKVIENKGEA